MIFVEKKRLSIRATGAIVLVLIAVFSFFVLGRIHTNPLSYTDTILTLENQKANAVALNVAATATAATLTLLPDDTASPIAEELADLSLPLFVIVMVLFVEKFVLTIFGGVAFMGLFPLACLLSAVNLYIGKAEIWAWVKKVTILALALMLIIPTGAMLTRFIENTYSDSLQLIYDAARNVSNETMDVEGEEGNFFTELWDDIANSVTNIVEMAKQVLSTMIDAVVVLAITSCVIPIATAFAFVCLVKVLFNVEIPIGKMALSVDKLSKTYAKRITGNRKPKESK